MNLSELDFHISGADPDAVVEHLRGLAGEHGWHLTVREREIASRVTYIWGRFINGPDEWSEANEEVTAGLGEITALEVPTDAGQRSRPVFLYHSPYRDQIVDALVRTGEPVFDWATHIVEAELSWSMDAPNLKISFDRRTGQSAEIGGQRSDDVVFLFTSHSWVLPLGGAGISDHLAAVKILDELRSVADVTVFDTTGYAEHRDDTLAIAVAVDRQQQLRQLRNEIGLS